MPSQASLDRPIAAVFALCQNYYLANAGPELKKGQAYKLVKEALTETLQAMASLHAVQYPGYRVDTDHAGYLIRSQPPMFFRVPYHVLPTFPTGHQLDVLWQMSQRLQSGNRSTISISGSNVLRRLFEIVGDIDFCEYLPVDDGFDRIISNLDRRDGVICLKLAFWKREWRSPWDKRVLTNRYFAREVDPSNKDKSTLKMVYVGEVENLGVTEISNLIIAIDKEGRSAGLGRTFAAQEVPLVPVDWLPNQMNDPTEMGRYINWLANSITALRQAENARKCLKRCASLSRILFLPDITNEIAELVEDHRSILLSYQKKQLEQLSAVLGKLTHEEHQDLTDAIDAQKQELSAKLEQQDTPGEAAHMRFANSTYSIAQRLLGHLRP